MPLGKIPTLPNSPLGSGGSLTIWILTCAYNDYDQHGEYYLAAFKDFPTPEQLLAHDIPLQAYAHMQKGGGRIDAENVWYYLRKEEI